MSSNGVHERGSISVAAFTIVAVGSFLAASLLPRLGSLLVLAVSVVWRVSRLYPVPRGRRGLQATAL